MRAFCCACSLSKLTSYRSPTQYKTKLAEWGFKKNTKGKDMRAIVRKDVKRKAEDMLMPSSFRPRGRPVPNQRIERYKKEKGLTVGDRLSDEATPSDINCDTPRNLPENPPSEPEAPRGIPTVTAHPRRRQVAQPLPSAPMTRKRWKSRPII